MAIPELRPLKLGIKGLSHRSRMERRLRARVKTNTALSFGHLDVIWNTEVSLWVQLLWVSRGPHQ